MKTRIVLSFDENEFARLAGAATARGLSCKDFVMKLVRDELLPTHLRALSSDELVRLVTE